MKKKYRYRKALQLLATKLGLEDKTILAGVENEATKQGSFQLINNNRRFVRGMLKLPLKEQLFRMNAIVAQMDKADEEAPKT